MRPLTDLVNAERAERDALREQTALLLDAAARRLAEDADANADRSPVSHRFQLGDFLEDGDHDPFIERLRRVEAQLRGWRPFGGPSGQAD